MQEYRDGSYGEVQEDNKLLEKVLLDQEERQRTRSIHFGSPEELEQIKLHGGNAKRIMAKLEQLERKLNRVIVALKIDIPGEILIVD